MNIIPMPNGNTAESISEWTDLQNAIDDAERFANILAFRTSGDYIQYTVDGTTWENLTTVGAIYGDLQTQINELSGAINSCKIYGDLSDLGLSGTPTMATIALAMSNRSMCILNSSMVDQTGLTQPSDGTVTVVVIFRQSQYRTFAVGAYVNANTTAENIDYVFAGFNGETWSGWLDLKGAVKVVTKSRLYYQTRDYVTVSTQAQFNALLLLGDLTGQGLFIELKAGTYRLKGAGNIAPLFENLNIHIRPATGETVYLDLSGAAFYTTHLNITNITIINTNTGSTAKIENGYCLFDNCTFNDAIIFRGGAVTFTGCTFKYNSTYSSTTRMAIFYSCTACFAGVYISIVGSPNNFAVFGIGDGARIITRSTFGISSNNGSSDTHYLFSANNGNLPCEILWNSGCGEYETGSGSYSASKNGNYVVANNTTQFPLIIHVAENNPLKYLFNSAVFFGEFYEMKSATIA